MNTKNLETFIAVSNYSSINAAAEALFISPPALQQQLNRLEKEIGFKLFERNPGGIRLTSAGGVFLEGVIKIRSSMDQLLVRCRETESMNSCLRIGAIAGLQPDLFPRVSAPFFQKYPKVVQKPVMESEDELFSDLDAGVLDAVEYYECARAHASGRNFAPVIREGRSCLLSPGHPLASREELTLEDLRGQHIIVYRFDRIPGFREYTAVHYPEIRVSEDPRIMDFYTMLRSYEDGHIGLVPPHVASQFKPLRAIPLRFDMRWAVGLVYREPCSPVLAQYIEVARQVFSAVQTQSVPRDTGMEA